MNKIEQLIEKIIDDMWERPFAMTWETEARNMRKILKKHLQSLQDTTEERGQERKIYILKNNYYGCIDVFNNKDATHYIQYQKKWDDRLKVKHWTLQELVWDYEYWDDIMNIELIEKTIVV